MEHVTIQISTVNDAFGESDEERREELGRILCNLGERFKQGQEPSKVMDANGNTIGTVDYD